MSVVTIAEVRALVASQLSDDDLQTVIDREEARLARRIGPLTGERTQRLWIRSGDSDGPRYLERYTDAVTVTDGGTLLADDAVRLLDRGGAIERASGAWTGPSIEVTYTPNDDVELVAAVAEYVALGMSVGAMESETLGDYSYKRPASPEARRAAIASRFTPRPRHGTIRVQTGSERITAVGAVASDAGS